jgi:phosphoenolpyruvate-protein phosphotransferase (PTS system enzyme I)
MTMMNIVNQLQGMGVSPGIAIGRACVIRQIQAAITGEALTDDAAVGREIAEFHDSVGRSIRELRALMAGAETTVAEILEVQVELLQDPMWEGEVLTKIGTDRKNAGDAVLEVTQELVKTFGSMEDEYLRGRAADIEDIGKRVMRHLRGGGGLTPAGGDGRGLGDEGDGDAGETDKILVATDLSPSDLIALDISRVVGFATRAGGKTSHASIVARLRGIAAVAGCGEGLDAIADGDLVVLDGTSGILLINPIPEVVEQYVEKRKEQLVTTRFLQSLKSREAITTDGIAVHLSANIGSIEDMEQALEYGAQGVGLLRTELLFMQSNSLPTEEEQFIFYKNILVRAAGQPVTIRTLDIGGDKALPYLPLPKEDNPFLGYRAIRISLDRKDLFLTQLKAILRASVFGECRILLPMIGGVQELRQAKALITEAKEELARQQLPYDEDIRTGIMIEVPSAAIMADQLAKEADFFSIGTNDLCQYTLAVDRMNEKIKSLYDPFHPAVLRLIRNVIEQGYLNHLPVEMCGELAGDPQATLLLLGMGLRDFSMNAPSIPVVKNIILQASMAMARAVYTKEMNNIV